MSIQDEISRINGAVSTQAGLIEQISTVLASKSGGGGGDITLETVSITPTESTQTITPSAGYDGIGVANVAAIPSNFVGSGVTRQAGKTVTPGDTQQTAVVSGRYTTGDIVVAPVPTATYIKRSELAEVRTVAAKPADGTGKNGDLFIMLG